jgi:CheY-like chemotaxis protein
MDLQMLKLNGYETTTILRKEMALTKPIIACSAHASNEERSRCIELGMNDYVENLIQKMI